MDTTIPEEFEGIDILDDSLLNKDKIRTFVEDNLEMRLSDNSYYILNDELKALLLKAATRAKMNGQSVINGKDI